VGHRTASKRAVGFVVPATASAAFTWQLSAAIAKPSVFCVAACVFWGIALVSYFVAALIGD